MMAIILPLASPNEINTDEEAARLNGILSATAVDEWLVPPLFNEWRGAQLEPYWQRYKLRRAGFPGSHRKVRRVGFIGLICAVMAPRGTGSVPFSAGAPFPAGAGPFRKSWRR
jgi:hypothetical protein